MIYIILLLVAYFLLSYQPDYINKKLAISLLDDKYFDLIIDVRNKSEFDEGHYKKAINIPYQELSNKKLEDLGIKEDTTILLYCNSGNRSKMSYNKLKNKHYMIKYTDAKYYELYI